MTKREFMESAWIHITKRLPPDEWDTLILTYNSQNGYMGVWRANMAREYAEICLDGRAKELSWDRELTHWMPLYPPQNGISYAEYCQQANKKGKK